MRTKSLFLVLMMICSVVFSLPVFAGGQTEKKEKNVNLLENPDFEGSQMTDLLRGWGKRGRATLSVAMDMAHDGTNSLLVKGRTAKWNGASCDILNLVKAGKTYHISAWVRLAGGPGEGFFYLQAEQQQEGKDVTYPIVGQVKVVSNEWSKIEGTYTVPEKLQKLSFFVCSKDDNLSDFYLDDAVLEVTAAAPVAEKRKLITELPTEPNPVTRSTAWVNYADEHQVIEGFGVASAWCAGGVVKSPSRDKVMDLLFDPDRGIGLTILRSMVTPELKSSAEKAPNWSVEENQFWMVKEAAKRGPVKFMSTVWSAPGYMKTNGSSVGGAVRPDALQSYADYLVAYIQGFEAQTGQKLDVISMANEPDFVPTYDGCKWTGPQIRDFIRDYVKPTFEKSGASVRFMAAEDMNFNESMVVDSLNDPVANARLDIVGVHSYSNGFSRLKIAESKHKPLWMTEVMGYWDEDNGILDGLVWAKRLSRHLAEANISGWNYWYAAGNGAGNGSLIKLSDNAPGYLLPKRYYAMGSYSKFVRPGFRRVGATLSPTKDVFLSAFKDEASGKLVVVAVNANVNAEVVDIKLNGFAANGFTAWRTTAGEDMVNAGEVAVASGSFVAELPARSWITYVATGAKAPAIPVTAEMGTDASALIKQGHAARGTPVVDGSIDAVWKTAPVMPLELWGEGTAGTEGASANVRALWDDTYLYVLAEVSKESALGKVNEAVYMQDSVEAFIDENDAKLGFYEADDAQYRVNYLNEASFMDNCDRARFQSKTAVSGDKYLVEMAIPLKTVKPVRGMVLGTEFQVNIEKGLKTRNILKWASSSASSYMDPSSFGEIKLE